jgi:three-Cys-motif partner protein
LLPLQELKASQPKVRGRTIEIVPGDFNHTVHDVLANAKITENTASFCLLDQRTFECHWDTARALAAHKRMNKIELFYFLASGWLDRSLAGTTRNVELVEKWWGRPEWSKLKGMGAEPRAEALRSRFCDELGYAHAYAWPIYERGADGRLMYHMIHATDHPDAPKIMNRAYFNATNAREPIEQLEFDLQALVR